MRVFNCDQGSPEWLRLRLGIPTGSGADQIMTPKTFKRSSSAGKYRARLLTEWFVGHPIEWGNSEFMERGTRLEPEAIRYYEMQFDAQVDRVGFVLADDGTFGGSPDGLIGEDSILEVKCPALHTHIGYITAPMTLRDEYHSQVQSYLALTGRSAANLFSYNPQLPEVVVPIERDENYIGAFKEHLSWFTGWLAEGKEMLAPYRAEPTGTIPGSVADLLERSLAEVG